MLGREIDWLRWLFYLLAGVPLIAWIFFTRDRVMRVAAVLGVVIFVHENLSGRRYFLGGFSLGAGLMMVYAALVARVFENRRLPQVGAYGWLWIALIFFAGFGVITGSLGTPLLKLNLKRWQLCYLEAFVFFLFGAAALRSPGELRRFFRFFVVIGLGAALVHFLTAATGFKFRGSTKMDDYTYYGGVFANANSLGSFYVMTIPIALVTAMRRSEARWIRILYVASIAVMAGSLVLTGSRGGLLFTALMCGFAMLSTGMNVGRAALAAIAGGGLGAVGFFVMRVFAGERWAVVGATMEQEGLESGRLETFWSVIRMILDHPLGVGLAPANLISTGYDYGLGGLASAHNIYLDMGLHTGILGLMVFVAMTGSIVLRNRRAIHLATDSDAREGLTYMYLVLVGYLAVGLVEPVYAVETKMAAIYALLAGLSVAAVSQVFAERRALALREQEQELGARLPLPAHARRA
jgi:O-antigen ligase